MKHQLKLRKRNKDSTYLFITLIHFCLRLSFLKILLPFFILIQILWLCIFWKTFHDVTWWSISKQFDNFFKKVFDKLKISGRRAMLKQPDTTFQRKENRRGRFYLWLQLILNGNVVLPASTWKEVVWERLRNIRFADEPIFISPSLCPLQHILLVPLPQSGIHTVHRIDLP